MTYPITDHLRKVEPVTYRVTFRTQQGYSIREYVTQTPENLGVMVWQALKSGWVVTAEKESTE